MNRRQRISSLAGASGAIGTAFAAKAPADGYTLLFTLETPQVPAFAPIVLPATEKQAPSTSVLQRGREGHGADFQAEG